MTQPRRPLIAGNWKMNGLMANAMPLVSELANQLIALNNTNFELLICPPFPYLNSIAAISKESGLLLGAQDCHQEEKGAHTGDVSAAMLKDMGCAYVITGHSERRANHGETDTLVKSKAEAAVSAGLSVIICVGETEEERDAGKANDVVASQIANSIPGSSLAANTVIAYEPVWAIGTGRIPSTHEIQYVHATMRREISEILSPRDADAIRLIYGGSVNPSNAVPLLALADVDGALVGGASLSWSDFWAIAKSCPPL